jgi:hypothetical protein
MQQRAIKGATKRKVEHVVIEGTLGSKMQEPSTEAQIVVFVVT